MDRQNSEQKDDGFEKIEVSLMIGGLYGIG